MKVLVILLLFITNFCYSQSFYFDCYSHTSKSRYSDYSRSMIGIDGKIWIDTTKKTIHIQSGKVIENFRITKWDKSEEFIECGDTYFWFKDEEIIVRKWIDDKYSLGFIQLHFISKGYNL